MKFDLAEGDGNFTDGAWTDVLAAVDRTYADLIAHQQKLEEQSEQLHELRRFIGSVMGSVSEIMAIVDRDGLIEEVSASLSDTTRSEPAALIGSDLAHLFVPAGAKAITEALTALRLSRSAAHFEADVMTADGPAPFEITLSARVNDSGRLIGAVLVGRPLGELRQAYSELEQSHQRLQEAQTQLVRNEKLASLGRLLAGVAHELNNPISFVYANTHALERYVTRFETYFERVQDGAEREELVALRSELKLERNLRNLRDAIQGASEGAERVRDIVADLRRLSADGTAAADAFDLVDTARVAAHWVERGSKSGVTTRFTGLDNLTIRGTPGHVQQIVMNLVQNAMDAVRDLDDPVVGIHVDRDADRAILTVTDNGPGVAAEHRDAIFDPFFTTKPVGQGTGLGLSISHKIAEEHGGSLSLGPGPGGAFQLALPLSTDMPQPQRETE
ncbi:sensor histidine kinase [Pseudooceanicola atlanticus]|uniref:sensor histidine kinase n=1 Tax=Pseudooceanicola atlanticus TaxID=1461694 RepID=UPI000693AA03|nr:ATP-binding protein [Pseudooceanicola atlanticus]